MSAWYKTWFNSENYLDLYKHRGDEDAENLISLIWKNVDCNKIKSVLDIACGAGRHSIKIAGKGLKVTAFDISLNLLKIAKTTADELSLDVDFFCGDIKKPCIKTSFDLVTNLFTSFGYFEKDEENFALFADVYKYLGKDGCFCFDYFNIDYLKRNLVPFSCSEENGKKITQKREFSANRVIKDIIIADGEQNEYFQESVALYSKEEIETELKKNEFRIENIYGDYFGSVFNQTESPRLIIFARK
ncbi:MAG: class I SAM-dependent methyltransferase [Ignavibacteriales bacterium]|nr:MAG: class I SAM-dependent methyltransferase [Ignavibacteriales bacterium]